jgi:hypothetical protein
VWPPSSLCSHRAVVMQQLLSETVEGMRAIAEYPDLGAPLFQAARSPYVGVMNGLYATLMLMSNAIRNVRSPIVCCPLPPWLYEKCIQQHLSSEVQHAADRCMLRQLSDEGALGSPVAARQTLTSPLNASSLEWNAPLLDKLIQSFPAPAQAFSLDNGTQMTAQSITAFLRALPAETLALLHWLVVMAPVRLVRVNRNDVPGALSFALVPGPHPVSSAGHQQIKSWELLNGEYMDATNVHERWYHGTSSENLYSTCHFGLRVMSGTRFEKTGAMYGSGVYCVNDARVAAGFAKPTGTCMAQHGLSHDWTARSDFSACTLRPSPMPYLGVFEMRIAIHPDNKIIKDGKPVPEGAPAPPCSYLVVPHARSIQSTFLHLFPNKADASTGQSSLHPVKEAKSGFTWVVGAILLAIAALLWKAATPQGNFLERT